LTSPYVQECLKPQGIVDIMQHFLFDTPTRYAVFAVSKNEQQGIVTDRETELGALLLPHLRRAVMISDVLDVRTIERARMAEALDALRCGVVLTDMHAAILHANSSADSMLRNGDGPVQSSGGKFVAKAAAAASELRAAIKLATQDEASIGRTGLAIRLTEPDEPPIFAHVLPLTGSDLRTRLQPSAGGNGRGLRPDAGRGAGADEPACRAHAGRDRRRVGHRRDHRKNAPRQHLRQDRRGTSGRSDAARGETRAAHRTEAVDFAGLIERGSRCGPELIRKTSVPGRARLVGSVSGWGAGGAAFSFRGDRGDVRLVDGGPG
jgi:hypothetical protein